MNIACLEKLCENDHKETWDNIPLVELLDLIIEEVFELREELYDLKAMRREAADVANYSAMIISACDKYIKDGLNSIEDIKQ
jgi:NTP pyrophosphatase (non-canonical NTP hydrolase)